MFARTIAATALAAAALAALAPSRDAHACGPDFEVDALSERVTTLADLEDGVFLDEAEHLVPPPAHPYCHDAGGAAPKDVPGESAAERALYDAGAAAWNRDDVETAERAFEQLLALPADVRRGRSTWAAYMLGRIRWGREDDHASARAAYRQVRALADAGFRDDACLAASSLGQEARLDFSDVEKIRLYAEQAALGHPDGGTSLLFVIRNTVDRGEEHEILGDAVGQRLLAAYLYSRSDELDEAQTERLWGELLSLPRVAGADRLAAAAYRKGDLGTAVRLLDTAADVADRDSPLARRVRAKLALRAGDADTAAALLASIDDGSSRRVCRDRTVLATGTGDFTLALDRAYAARLPDTLYLAERVVTVDELRAFVDALPRPESPTSDGRWTIDTVSMRGILARRLVRDGRIADALPYFASRYRWYAASYAGDLELARATTDDITRAEALYQASRIARTQGLEIMGTAHAPDWESYHGDYDVSEYVTPEDPGPWITAAEDARVADSAPDSTRRWHYRHIAADLAEQAVDLLPKKSQARAAMMCWSARHVRYRDHERLERLYHRYLREGPFDDFDGNFGIECPEPDFVAARATLPLGPAPPWQLVLTALLTFLAGAHLFHRMWPRATRLP